MWRLLSSSASTVSYTHLRGMQFSSAGAWVPQVIAVGVTAGLHWWRRSTLLSIAAGTMCYMLLVQLVF